MAKFSTLYRTDSHKLKDVTTATRNAIPTSYTKAKDVAQSTYATALDAAQSTYENVQDKLHTGVDKASATMTAGLSLAEELLKHKPMPSKKAKKMAQKRFSKFQEAIQGSISTASDTLTSNTQAAQSRLRKGTKDAQKNLGKVQKNLASTLDETSNRINKGTKQASKNLHKASRQAKDMQASTQTRVSHQIAKTLFRTGIVTGVVLALLFTPIAGSEVRSRIAATWKQYRTYLGL